MLLQTRAKQSKILNRHFSFLALYFLASCSPLVESNDEKGVYFDINGLIDQQVVELVAVNPSLHKVAFFNHEKEVTEFTPKDSASWSQELQMIKALDINKAILVDSYRKTDSKGQVIYISVDPESTLVDTLSIHFNDQKLFGIRGYLHEENAFFNTSRTISVDFTEIKGTSLISQFSIDGWQKMISRDSTSYSINSLVNLPRSKVKGQD